VQGEILTGIQEKNIVTRGLAPDAVGHKIDLKDPNPLSFGKRLIPGASLKHSVDLHGMDSVTASMQKDPPWGHQ